MTAAEIVVTIAGSCAIVWINYWFFKKDANRSAKR